MNSVELYGCPPLQGQGLRRPDKQVEQKYNGIFYPQSGWYRGKTILVPEQELTCSGIFYIPEQKQMYRKWYKMGKPGRRKGEKTWQ
jgi:hypothetical protein